MTIKLKGEADLRTMTFQEKVKFYTSLCLGTTALLSVFAFLFLIPFVVDPSISTILANYDPVPVVCTTIRHVYTEGITNCSWTSCKEGCTSITPRCHLIYVNYSTTTYREWSQSHIPFEKLEWAEGDVKFYVNTEGCGYPPKVNCSEFVAKYGWSENGPLTYPCYYSRHYPKEKVVANYDRNSTVKNLFLAIGIPNIIFGLSIGILSYWYCWPLPFDKKPNILYPVYDFNISAAKEKRCFVYTENDAEEDYDNESYRIK